MAIFELQAPDGTIYEVDAPDEQSAVNAFSQMQGGAPQLTAKQEYDQAPWYQQIPQAADDIARAVANGVTFGFADKIAGYLGGEGTEAERELSRQAQERAGLAYNAAELAGGLRTALSAGNAGLSLIGAGGTGSMTGIGGLAARTGLASLEGAGYGGLSALGNDTSLAQGIGMGAAFGAGGNLAGEGIQAGINAFRNSGATNRAREYLQRAAGNDAITPASAASSLDELGASATLADLGPNMRAQGAAIATTPGEGQSVIRGALGDRSAGASDRINKSLSKSMGGRQNVVELVDDIVAKRSAEVEPLYSASRNLPVQNNEVLDALLSRPSAKSAVASAKRNMLDRGEVFDINNPTVGMLDEIKKSLDGKIGMSVRAGDNSRVAPLTDIKNQIVEFADSVSPDYAKARSVFSSEAKVVDALADGVKAFDNNLSPDALRKYVAGLDDASREAYISGARQKVQNVMGTARNDAAAVRTLFNKGYNAEKLSILLGDDAAKQILNTVKSEDVFQATKNAILGGSDTKAKIASNSLIAGGEDTGSIIKSLLNLNLGDASVSAANKAFSGIVGARNNATNAEIARMLIANDASVLQPLLKDKTIRDKIARALIGSGAASQEPR